jgi:hypothetical protein
LNGYAGLGVAVWRKHHVSAFGEAGFGGMAFVGETSEGFENDVFDNFGFFSVKSGLSFKF